MRANTFGRVAVAFVVAVAARQLPAQIANGGFETGDLSGWTVDVWPGSSGGIGAWDQFVTPLSAFPAVGPRSGAWYATTDQTGPGAYAISQSFTVTGAVTSATLRFSLSTSDWSGVGPIVGPDFDPFNSYANQFVSVDLLSGVAGGFATTGILRNFFEGAAPELDPWRDYVFDITGLLSPGTYTLRFAEVDNQLFFNMGVDDVSLDIRTTATPEPATLTLVAAGALLLGAAAARRRRG